MNGRVALIVALAILFLGQLIFYYPQMPDPMASHFNSFGEPDGWMSRNGFFAFEIGLLIFCVSLFFATTRFLTKLPDSLINMPRKDYWLAPERRAATLSVFRDKMEAFYIPVFLLLVIINQFVFRANLTKENLPLISWLFIGAFVVYTIIWSINLNRKFKVYES